MEDLEQFEEIILRLEELAEGAKGVNMALAGMLLGMVAIIRLGRGSEFSVLVLNYLKQVRNELGE